jgi:hypothetical protein
MAKRKNHKAQRSPAKKTKELHDLYAKMRRDFTAADLQKYTQIEEGIPLKQVIAEMEEIHRKLTRKRA